MHQPSRRTVLVGGAALLAGCSGVSAPLSGQTEEPCTGRTFLFEPTDWAFPAYDAANTGCAPAESAPGRDADRSVAWRQAFDPHPGTAGELRRAGQPVVADGQLFVAYLPLGPDDIYSLSALDTETGAINWTREFEAGQVGTTPFIVGETAYYVTEDGDDGRPGLALNVADGTTLTRLDDVRSLWFGGGHAIGYGGGTTHIAGRSPVDWHTCWEFETPGRVQGIASDAEQVVIAMATDNGSRFESRDATTGEPDWTVTLSSQYGAPINGIALRGDHLVVATTSHLLAMRRNGTDSVWSVEIGYKHETGETDDGEAILASVQPELGAITENTVVVLRYDFAHIDSRIEVYSRGGTKQWTTEPEEGWWQSPVVAGETVFTFVTPKGEDTDAELRSYDLATGERLNTFGLGQSVYHRPLVADGRIFGVGDSVVAVE